MLTCPACFAREIDPVFLKTDPEDGELYCTQCTYTAPDAATVRRFFDTFVHLKFGVVRAEPTGGE